MAFLRGLGGKIGSMLSAAVGDVESARLYFLNTHAGTVHSKFPPALEIVQLCREISLS